MSKVWDRLSLRTRLALLLAAMFAGANLLLFRTPLTGVSWLDFTWQAVAVLFPFVLVAGLVCIVTAKPEDVIAEDEAWRSMPTRGRRWLTFALIGGTVVCAVIVWLAVRILESSDLARQVNALASVGTIMLAIVAGLPLVMFGAIRVAGLMIRPSWLCSAYDIHAAADPLSAWTARADIPASAQFTSATGRVEEISAGPAPRYRLHPRNLTARLLGIDMTVEVVAQERGMLLVLESVTKAGDRERLAMRFEQSPDGGTIIHCRLLAHIRSSFLKTITYIAGHAHIAEGGARTEAQRLGKLLNLTAEAKLLSSQQTAERPDVDF